MGIANKTTKDIPKKPVGRPKTVIDLEQAEKLGKLQCTLEECSAWFGIPLSTLSTHKDFSEAYKRGRQKGKRSLRRYQWGMAKTNCTMAIWLGKQYLGQSDSPYNDDDAVPQATEFKWEKID